MNNHRLPLPIVLMFAVLFAGNITTHAQLSGAYTINSAVATGGTNFQSFTAAVSALNASGVNGPVTFTVVSASGPYTEQISITSITGANATNTITFDGNGEILRYTPTSANFTVVDLNGADYVTFTNLTVVSQSSTYGHLFKLRGQANYNRIVNCTLDLTAITSTTSANASWVNASNSLTSTTTAGNNANYCTIEGNTMVGNPYYGICLYGTSTSTLSTNFEIKNNTLQTSGSAGSSLLYYPIRLYYLTSCNVENNTITDSYAYGIYCYYVTASTIKGNDISRPNRTTVTSYYGIYLSTGCHSTTVSKNRLHNTCGGGPTASTASYCIYISSTSATSGNEIKVINNAIYDVTGNSTQRGIYSSSGQFIWIYYNTIALDYTASTSTNECQGIYTTATSGTGPDVKNNIVSITRGGTGTKHCLYFSGASTTTSNYNDLYMGSTSGTNYIGYWNSSNASTLAAWQGYTPGYDAASKSVDPLFENPSAGNYKPQEALINDIGMNLSGAPYNISEDILGAPRSTTPDPGAWEFALVPMSVSSIAATQTVTTPVLVGSTNQQIMCLLVTTSGALTPLTVTQLNLSTNGSTSASDIANAKVYFTGASSTFSTGNLFGSTAAPSGAFSVTGSQVLSGGANYFWVTYDIASTATVCNTVDIECPSMLISASLYNPSPTAPAGFRIIKSMLSGAYTINASATPSCTVYTSLSDAVNDLALLGVSGAVTFNVASGSGPYTEHLSIGAIPGASSTNTITFNGNGNTLQWTPTSADISIVDMNGCDYVTFDNFTIKTQSTTYGVGFLLRNQADYNTIKNCNIDLTSLPASAGSTTAYIAASNSLTSATTSGNNANYCTIENNTMTGTPYYGISFYGTSTTVSSTDVAIINNSINVYYYGIRLYYITASTVERNSITDFYAYGMYCYYLTSSTISRNDFSRPTRTTSTTAYGIYITTSSSGLTVEKNRIHNLFDAMTTSTSTAYGIYCSVSGTSTNYQIFRNNLIYAVNGAGAQYGIYNSGNYSRIHHNTISLDDQAASSSTTYGIYVTGTSTPGTDVLNNSVMVTRASSGSIYGLYFSGAAAVTCNYNNLYVDVPGNSSAATGYYNASTGGTLAQWQAVNGGAFDQNSVAANPAYENPATGNYKPMALALNNAGTDLYTGGFVTDDILGNSRSSTPDIGAYEFTPSNMSYSSSTTTQTLTTPVPIGMTDAQIVGVQVQTLGALSPISLTSFTFNTSGSTTASDIAAARVYYTGTSPAFAAVNQFGSSVSAPSGSFNITGTQTLASGMNYFWLVYDISSTAAANNVVDAQCNSVTVGGTPRTPSETNPSGNRQLLAPMSGAYTVGSGGSFATLSDAFALLNTVGLGGNTTLNIISDIAEPGMAVVNQWIEVPASSNYRLAIQPSGGAARTVSASVSSGAVIKLNGADRVVIDGLNTGGNSLAISNNSTSTHAVIWIQSLGAGSGCNNVMIRNTTITCGSNTSTSFGILVNGSSAVGTTSSSSDNENLTIQNNDVRRALYGIYATAASPGFNDSLRILGNTVGSTSSTNYIHYKAVYIDGATEPTISQNTITGVFDDRDGYRVSGIELGQYVTDAEITRNAISNIKGLWYDASIDDGNGAFGIKMTSGTGVSDILVANNMIWDVMSAGYYDYKESQPYGIWIYGGDTVKIHNNSVYLYGAFTNYSTSAACQIMSSSVANVDMRNNIFRNSITGPSGTYSYAVSVPSGYGFSAINNNDYYVSGTNGVLGYYGADKTTLNDWRLSSGQDGASLSVDPLFASTANLHINSGSTPTQLESGGAPIAGLTIDYDGDTRPGPNNSQNGGATAPDIGADEFDGVPNDLIPPIITVTPLDITNSTSQRTITATISDASGVPTTGAGLPRLYWRINAGSYNSATATSLGGGQYQFAFGAGVATYDVVSYYIVAQDMAATPNVGASPSVGASGFSTNPPACTTPPASPYSYYIQGTLAGGVVSVPGTYSTLTGAGGFFDVVNKSVVTGNITVNITNNLTEDGAVALNEVLESPVSSNYTITIRPDGSAERLIAGSVSTGGMIRLNGADRVTIDGRYNGSGRYLRLRNTATSHGTIYLSNDASFNTVRNCFVEGSSTSTGNGTITILAGNASGNDNNTFRENVIRDRSDAAGVPSVAFYSIGTSTVKNDNITVSDNEIPNFAYYGVYASSTGTGDAWSIEGNSIYCSLATPPSTVAYPVCLLGGGNGHSVSGNYIGGTAPNCGGSAWTHPGTATFYGIYLTAGTTTNSSVQGNTIQNLAFSGSSGTIYLMYITGGNVDIGTVTGNLIGNTITPNSITTSRSAVCYLLYVTTSGNAAIRNNVIANVTSTHTGSTTFGCLYRSGGGQTDISGNTVHSCSSASGNTTQTTTSAMFGILSTSTGGGQTIIGNTVYNLRNSGGAGSVVTMVQGIDVTGSGASGTISNNKIYGLENTSNGQAHIVGLHLYAGSWTAANNMISLSNGSNGNDIIVRGILNDNATTVTNEMIYNSVYVGGAINSGSAGSQAFSRTVAATNKHVDNIYYNNRSGGSGAHVSLASSVTGSWSSDNNLLVAPSSAAVAVWNNTAYSFSGFITASGNDNYSVNGDPLVLTPSSLFRNVSSGDLGIMNTDPNCWYVNGKGIAGAMSNSIADDFAAASVRSTTLGLATDIGADEFTTNTTPPMAAASAAPAANTTTVYSFAGQILASIAWGTGGTVPTAVDFRYYSGDNPPAPLTGNYSNAFANITVTGGTGYSYNITLGYSPAWLGSISSESNIRLAKRDGAVWSLLAASTVNTSSKTVTMTGLTSFSDFALTDALNPLPVELTAFTARLRGQAVRLDWSTASEVNALRYEVERRATGGWEAIGSVDARGAADKPSEYSFFDDRLPEAAEFVYRLKMVDRDGSFDYSQEVRVRMLKADGFNLFVNYPNPFNPATTISFSLPAEQFVTVRIVDATGREVEILHSGLLPAGIHSSMFLARDLPSGIYTCVVTAGAQTRTGRMVLAR